MTPDLDRIFDMYPDTEFLKIDGHDNAVLGVVLRYGMEPILCYDLEKVLGNLYETGMTEEESIEWFEFNIIGAWVGESTPCFLVKPEGAKT